MYDALAELGNPFTDDRADLFALDRKIVPGAEDIKHLYAVEMIGQEQFKSFMDTRILKNNPISDTIVKNNSHADLQMRKFKGKKTHKDAQLKVARSDATLYSKLSCCHDLKGCFD